MKMEFKKRNILKDPACKNKCHVGSGNDRKIKIVTDDSSALSTLKALGKKGTLSTAPKSSLEIATTVNFNNCTDCMGESKSKNFPQSCCFGFVSKPKGFVISSRLYTSISMWVRPWEVLLLLSHLFLGTNQETGVRITLNNRHNCGVPQAGLSPAYSIQAGKLNPMEVDSFHWWVL